MPIILGAPRSGTTLLRLMIDAHPDVAIPPETGFLTQGEVFTGTGEELRRQFVETITSFPADMPTWPDFGIPKEMFRQVLQRLEPFTLSEGYRAFYRTYAERFGKPRWGDKTPMSCLHLNSIEAVIPEAHFIHLIRDGRDVALSWRQTWFSPGPAVEVQAEHMEHRSRVRPDGTVVVSHATRLRQQALTMQPPQRSRIQVWKGAMDRDERVRFELVAKDLLQALEYDV